MLRFLAWLFLLLTPAVVLANDASAGTATLPPALQGLVADATGAIVSGAQVDLLELNGVIAGNVPLRRRRKLSNGRSSRG